MRIYKEIVMGICSFCSKETNKRLVRGLCLTCYRYFFIEGNITFEKSKYGSLSFVQNKKSKQFGQVICHECGKGFVKLQQHIFHQHSMSKIEYCDRWGLDHKIKMTELNYHNKMSNHAYKNNMDKRLSYLGEKTRFRNGGKNGVYKRSYQTKERLRNNFKGVKNNNDR